MFFELGEKYHALEAKHGSRAAYAQMPDIYRKTHSYEQFESDNHDFWDAKLEEAIEEKKRQAQWIKDNGLPFFDYDEFTNQRVAAIIKSKDDLEKKRKKLGDDEILNASAAAVGRVVGEYAWTKSFDKVFSAIVNSCSETGMLFAGAEGLAALAGVSRRTAFAVRKAMEKMGMIVRVSTGGRKESNGAVKTMPNRYFIRYNTIRDLFAIKNRWESRYDQSAGAKDPQRYYNHSGFAHESKSDRAFRAMSVQYRAFGAGKAFAETLKPFGGHMSTVLKGTTNEARKHLVTTLECTLSRLKNKIPKYKESKTTILGRETTPNAESWLELLPIDLYNFLFDMVPHERESFISSFTEMYSEANRTPRECADMASRTLIKRKEFKRKREETQLQLFAY